MKDGWIKRRMISHLFAHFFVAVSLSVSFWPLSLSGHPLARQCQTRPDQARLDQVTREFREYNGSSNNNNNEPYLNHRRYPSIFINHLPLSPILLGGFFLSVRPVRPFVCLSVCFWPEDKPH